MHLSGDLYEPDKGVNMIVNHASQFYVRYSNHGHSQLQLPNVVLL